MTHWTIEPIPLYSFSVPGPEVLHQRAFFDIIDMVIYSYVLRSDAATVLVDTGLPPDLGPVNDSVKIRKGPGAQFKLVGERLADRLRTSNIVPDAIVLTSFGRYAASGSVELPGIDMYVSARGIAHMNSPEEPAMVHPLMPPVVDRINSGAMGVDKQKEIYPGLLLVETGVHHPGSMSLVIDTENGKVALSDFVFVARNLKDGLALGCAEHVAAWHGMVRKIGTMAQAIIPIHDPSPQPVGREMWHSILQTGPIAQVAL